jgi:hypothetical protein
MNTKIFKLITENLTEAFNLPKYQNIIIDQDTVIDQLPWTPARYKKFKDAMWDELQLTSDYVGTVKTVVAELSETYTHRFFAEIWKPRTGEYDHSDGHWRKKLPNKTLRMCWMWVADIIHLKDVSQT